MREDSQQIVVKHKSSGCFGCLVILLIIFVGLPLLAFFLKAGFIIALFSGLKQTADRVLPDWPQKEHAAQHQSATQGPPPPIPIRSIGQRTRTFTFSFTPDSIPQQQRVSWQNGNEAAIVELDETNLIPHSTDRDPDHRGGGHGLYVTIYAFNNKGAGNYFSGSKCIKIGDEQSGTVYVRSKTVDCDDLSFKIEVEDIVYYGWPNNRFRSRGFKGMLTVTVFLDE